MSSPIIPDTPSAKSYESDQKRDVSWFTSTDPIALLETWLKVAAEAEINDPNAMSLATVDGEGMPDVRMVLLKELSEDGLVFYTNENSAKGIQLKETGKAALCFHWKSLRRQVRVRGAVARVSDAQSDAYFSARARRSQLGAWCSDQSQSVADREALMAALQAAEQQFEGQDVPRPPNWYGWKVAPQAIEFWQDGAYRLHDRLTFTKHGEVWEKTRLFP